MLALRAHIPEKRACHYYMKSVPAILLVFLATTSGTFAQVYRQQLNQIRAVTGDVEPDFQVTPDGSVVYVADQDTDNVFELYSVPIGGGATTKLNGALTAGGEVDHSIINRARSQRMHNRTSRSTEED